VSEGRADRVPHVDPSGSLRVALSGSIGKVGDLVLTEAYAAAVASDARRIVLDFGAVDYINSTGIALIIRLLAEARRDRRAVEAVGLSDHYRHIFRITKLADYITIRDEGMAESDPERRSR
jgi:anti-sigma B factor antagonist